MTTEITEETIETSEMNPFKAFNLLVIKGIDSLKEIVLDLKERLEKLEKKD